MQDFLKTIEQSSLSFCSVDLTLSDADVINEILSNARIMLNMEVAFISEFTQTHRVFRFIDSEQSFQPIKVNDSDPLAQSYCQKVVDGLLPELIADAQLNQVALQMPATKALPIGAHISVPIIFSGGQIFGTFCCFSRIPNTNLNETDLNAVRFIAMCCAKILERSALNQQVKSDIRKQITRVLANDDLLKSVFQPFISIPQHHTIGYEALTRFKCSPQQPPDIWFKQADLVSLSPELELLAAKKAVEIFFKDGPEQAFLSINLSPQTIKAKPTEFTQLVNPHLKRLVIEL